MNMTNFIIKSTLGDLLKVLDARSTISIYTNKTTRVFYGEVFMLLADASLMRKYKNYIVTGVIINLVNNIMISEEGGEDRD